MTKISSKKHPSIHTTLTSNGVTDPIPASDAPSPPDGFVPSKLGRTKRPQHVQAQLAPRVAHELLGAKSYEQQFGEMAPPPGPIADALTIARAWSDKLRNASEWAAYVSHQEHLAWDHAMRLAGELRVPFEFHATRDPSIAGQYPSVNAFLNADKARGQRAASTRVKKRKAKATPAAPPKPETPQSPPIIDAVKTAAVKLLN